MYLAQSLFSVASYLERQGVVHGDLRPETVLISESKDSSGTIFISDNGLTGLFKTGYERCLSDKSQKAYLTPFLLKELSKREQFRRNSDSRFQDDKLASSLLSDVFE